jgi:hypothetical protein
MFVKYLIYIAISLVTGNATLNKVLSLLEFPSMYILVGGQTLRTEREILNRSAKEE